MQTRILSVLIAIVLTLSACGRTESPEPPTVAENSAKTSAATDARPALEDRDKGPFTAAAKQAVAQITPAYLEQQIRKISSDEFAGRGPASPGDVAARQYLADQLQALGYEPGAADGGWEQAFDIVGINAKVPDQWTFEKDGDSLSFSRWDQFIAASGVQDESASIEDAEIVFAGYAIQAPEYDWDDFKGADLKGKVLLILNNDPHWDPELFAGETRLYYGRWRYKYESAARQGAAGAIIVHTTPSAGYPWQVVQTSWTGEQFELPTEGEPRIQVQGWLTESVARELVTFAGQDLDALTEAAKSRDFEPIPLGIRTSLSLENTLNEARTANVLGLMRGSDSVLAEQAVVYTAHHDHLGVGEPDESGDDIYNGALDNATGVAQVLAIAKALRALPEAPRRSVLIALVAVEEQGLLGSQYYAANPTFAPGKIAANINYDGGNMWGKTRDVTLIGKGKSSLDDIATRITIRQGRTLEPDQFPDRGMFYRSDQFNFAKIGVPALYFKRGTSFVGRPVGWGRKQIEDYEKYRYHQPGDEIDDSWKFDGMIDDVKLGFWAGLIVANADEMPVWVPGDEFEAARIEALAAIAD